MNCDICNSRKARICIQMWAFADVGLGFGADTFYLCKRCAKMFDDLLYNSNKKMLERAVEPECSNTRSDFNSMGVPLDD